MSFVPVDGGGANIISQSARWARRCNVAGLSRLATIGIAPAARISAQRVARLVVAKTRQFCCDLAKMSLPLVLDFKAVCGCLLEVICWLLIAKWRFNCVLKSGKIRIPTSPQPIINKRGRRHLLQNLFFFMIRTL